MSTTYSVLTCDDFEEQGLWNTDECCTECHLSDEEDTQHEMHGESYRGQAIQVCIPLFEHLFCGAERRIPDWPIEQVDVMSNQGM